MKILFLVVTILAAALASAAAQPLPRGGGPIIRSYHNARAAGVRLSRVAGAQVSRVAPVVLPEGWRESNPGSTIRPAGTPALPAPTGPPPLFSHSGVAAILSRAGSPPRSLAAPPEPVRAPLSVPGPAYPAPHRGVRSEVAPALRRSRRARRASPGLSLGACRASPRPASSSVTRARGTAPSRRAARGRAARPGARRAGRRRTRRSSPPLGATRARRAWRGTGTRRARSSPSLPRSPSRRCRTSRARSAR